MPRYDLSELALKFGVKSDPLTTGEFKNTLDPLKPLNDEERKLWANILNQSYESFVNLIDENREKLDKEAVKKLATGQIYTADDAIKNGLVDEIAFEDEILDKLKSDLKLTSVKVIKYKHTPTITDFLAGNAQAKEQGIIEQLLESSVPRAMYYFAWNGAIKNDM
jgi:protease-4